MNSDLTGAEIWELGSATDATTGIGPIPEFNLGQPATAFCDD